jgi:hypothetical protein
VRPAAALLLLALAAIAGCGDDERRTNLDVDYSYTSNGVLSFHVDVHIRSDGTVTANSDYEPGCPASPAKAKVDQATLDRLSKVLQAARLPEQESIEEPGLNIQELEIRNGGVTYRHVSAKPLPKPVQPLVSELSRITAFVCDVNRPAAP